MGKLAFACLVACSSPHVTPATPAIATPDAAVAPDAPPRPAADMWIREIVDDNGDPFELALGIVNGAPAIAAGFIGWPHVEKLALGGAGWTASLLHDRSRAHLATWDGQGRPWLAIAEPDRKLHVYGPAGPGEIVGPLEGDLHPADGGLGRVVDLAFDRAGEPHLCAGDVDAAGDPRILYAARRGGTWTTETIAERAGACAIAVEPDGTVDIAVATYHGTAVHVRRAGAWTRETLAKQVMAYRSVAAATGADGTVAIAYADGNAVELIRRAGTAWTHEHVVADAGAEPRGLALALDAHGGAHVTYAAGRAISYVPPHQPPAKLVEATTPRTAIALDATGAPHIAYIEEQGRSALVYVRPRRPDEAVSTELRRGRDALIDACAEAIAVAIGRRPSDVVTTTRATRQCGALGRVAIEELVARCDRGEAAACLVGAWMAADDRKVVTAYDLRFEPCTGRVASTQRCQRDMFTSQDPEVGPRSPGAADAIKLYRAACDKGVAVACLQGTSVVRAGGRSVFSGDYVRACSPELPVACAAAAATIDLAGADAPKQLALVRGELARACAYSADWPKRCATDAFGCDFDPPEACNALAFLEEAGLGGPAAPRDAAAHHALACERGSASSCTRLLAGPFARPPAPARLAPKLFMFLMHERCDVLDEGACLALATALETGWVVAKNGAAAHALLDGACDERMAKACKRIGRPVPPPDNTGP